MTRMPTLLETGGEPGPQAGQAGPEATGSRKRTGPAARWLERAAQAITPDEQLTVAYDRLRAHIARLRKPGRDQQEREANTDLADQMATAAAQVLHDMCQRDGDGGLKRPPKNDAIDIISRSVTISLIRNEGGMLRT